jgi:hypothetical protein
MASAGDDIITQSITFNPSASISPAGTHSLESDGEFLYYNGSVVGSQAVYDEITTAFIPGLTVTDGGTSDTSNPVVAGGSATIMVDTITPYTQDGIVTVDADLSIPSIASFTSSIVSLSKSISFISADSNISYTNDLYLRGPGVIITSDEDSTSRLTITSNVLTNEVGGSASSIHFNRIGPVAGETIPFTNELATINVTQSTVFNNEVGGSAMNLMLRDSSLLPADGIDTSIAMVSLNTTNTGNTISMGSTSGADSVRVGLNTGVVGSNIFQIGTAFAVSSSNTYIHDNITFENGIKLKSKTGLPKQSVEIGHTYIDAAISTGDKSISIGEYVSAGIHSVAIGYGTNVTASNPRSTTLGYNAGNTSQSAETVAIGESSGHTKQGEGAVSVGKGAGHTSQKTRAVAVGYNAGKSNQNDTSIAVGSESGAANQGISSVAIGKCAGKETQGAESIAIGLCAGENEQKTFAVAIGRQAGFCDQRPNAVAIGKASGYRSQGSRAVALGDQSGYSAQGDDAVSLGSSAGHLEQGKMSIALGYKSGYSNQGSLSIAIGSNAGVINQGTESTAIGTLSGKTEQGDQCAAFGVSAGQIKQRDKSTAIGFEAGRDLQNTQSVSIGFRAGIFNQGSNSTAIGFEAGYDTQNTSSTAIGFQAGYCQQSSQSVAIGSGAGYCQQCQNSISIGNDSGKTKQSKSSIAIGGSAGKTNQGSQSIAIGTSAGEINQQADTISIGPHAGYTGQSSKSTAIGINAGYENQGAQSTAIGAFAGELQQGEKSIAIGPGSGKTKQNESSVAIGTNAGQDTQGTQSLAIGFSSAFSKQGKNCVAIGPSAGYKGQNNNSIAIGLEAGYSGQLPDSISIGLKAGHISQGSQSISLGFEAGRYSQSNKALALGFRAGLTLQGGESSAIGLQSGMTNQGSQCTAIGANAGETKQGDTGTAIGTNAGMTSQGASSLAIGFNAGLTSQKPRSIAMGVSAGKTDQGAESLAIGYEAGMTSQNTQSSAIGYNSGKIGQGSQSLAIGYQAGYSLQVANAAAIGYQSGYDAQGDSSLAIGYQAGYKDQNANAAAIGYQSGYSGQGDSSLAIGYQAGYSGQKKESTSIGYKSGLSNQGSSSIAIGFSAGENNQDNNSVAIGSEAGYSNQGASSIAIGKRAGYTGQGANSINISTAGDDDVKENTIIINATNAAITNTQSDRFYIDPLRTANTTDDTKFVVYDTVSKELHAADNFEFEAGTRVDIGKGGPDIDGTIALSAYQLIGSVASNTNATVMLGHDDTDGASSIVFRSTNDRPSTTVNSNTYGYLQLTETGGTAIPAIIYELGLNTPRNAVDKIAIYTTTGDFTKTETASFSNGVLSVGNPSTLPTMPTNTTANGAETSLNVQGSVYVSDRIYGGGNTNGDLYIDAEGANGDVHINTSDGVGNVGIGTTTPSAKLHVSDNSMQYQVLIENNYEPPPGTAAPRGGIMIKANNTKNTTNFLQISSDANANFIDSPGTGGLSFYNNGGGPYTWNGSFDGTYRFKMRLTDDGDLGIGTPTPLAKLHVHGNMKTDRVIGNLADLYIDTLEGTGGIYLNYYGGSDGVHCMDGGGTGTYGTATLKKLSGPPQPPGEATAKLEFDNNAILLDSDLHYFRSAEGGNRMFINSDGNVGIGATPNPSEKLEVVGNIKCEDVMARRIRSPNGTEHMYIADNGVTKINMWTSSTGFSIANSSLVYLAPASGHFFYAKPNGTATFGDVIAGPDNNDPTADHVLHIAQSGLGVNGMVNIVADNGYPVSADASWSTYSQISISSASSLPFTITPTNTTGIPGTLKIGYDHTAGSLGCAFIQGIVNWTASEIPLALCPKAGNVGIGTTSPSEKLEVGGNIKCADLIASRLSCPSPGFLGALDMVNDSYAYGWTYMTVKPQNDFGVVLGATNKRFRQTHTYHTFTDSIYPSTAQFDTGGLDVTSVYITSAQFYRMVLRPENDRGVSLGSSTMKFDQIYAHQMYVSNGTVVTSDDRLKHNEEDVTGALDTINKLKLQKYDKTSVMMDADFNGDLTGVDHFKELGFIAQDVMKIPELAFLVDGGGTEEVVDTKEVVDDETGEVTPATHKTVDVPYNLNYGGINNLAIQAIQELCEQRKADKAHIEALAARIELLEKRGV